ncbi:MAG: hypothetical protein ACOYBL_01995 [Lachnospiraceae bacterium]
MEMMEMTWKQKLSNFWFYYKWRVILGVFIGYLLLHFLIDMITRVDYDYSVAILSETMFFNGELEKVQDVLEEYAEDRNGNGKVDVQVIVYTLPQGDTVDPQTVASGKTQFLADMQEGYSMIFLYSDTMYELYEEEEPWENPEKIAAYSKLYDAVSDTILKDYNIAIRQYENTTIDGDEEATEYYNQSLELLESLR